MDPELTRWLASAVKHGRFLFCPTGSHLLEKGTGGRSIQEKGRANEELGDYNSEGGFQLPIAAAQTMHQEDLFDDSERSKEWTQKSPRHLSV